VTVTEAPPIACALTPGAFEERIAWIAALTRDALRSHERRDLVLDLRYAPEAAERVREMVRNEQACCSFLAFDLREQPDEIQLVITAPEAAREAADMLFEHFVAAAPHGACGCATDRQSSSPSPPAASELGATTVGLTAMTLATGAVVCGACCVLSLALPAAALAGTGSILAWAAGAHAWVTGLAVVAVLGAWGWIAWQTVQTRCRPGSTCSSHAARQSKRLLMLLTLKVAIFIGPPLSPHARQQDPFPSRTPTGHPATKNGAAPRQ
jgi:hypothetical protein